VAQGRLGKSTEQMKGDIGPRRRDRDETGGRLPRRRDGEAGKESWCEVEWRHFPQFGHEKTSSRGGRPSVALGEMKGKA
jgi:hypothetical protein